MTARPCICPQGLILARCEYHGHMARKGLDRLQEYLTRPFSLGGYTGPAPAAEPTPPLIVQHHRKDST